MNGTTPLGLLLPSVVCVTALSCGFSGTRSSSSETTCGTIDDIPFISDLTVPTNLPKGLTLRTACWSESTQDQDADFFFASEGEKGILTIVIFMGEDFVPVEQNDRPAVQLGDLTGYSSDTVGPEGTTLYSVEFEKDARSYSIGASPGPANNVTKDDVNAVALSIAEN